MICPDPPGALLLDLEGTLHMGDVPIPGAPSAVRRLEELGIPVRFITNTTRFSRAELALRLQAMSFPVCEDQLFTAPRAAASLLQQRGIGRAMLCIPDSTRGDFAGIQDVQRGAEAVVVGDLGQAWTFELLNHAFRALMDGAVLVALQKNRYWMTPEGLTLDAGPFVSALEHAAGTTAILVGKPAVDFFALAAESVGSPRERIAVVGDDVETDVGGGQRAGMRGALVRTGKFTEEALIKSKVIPDQVADSIVDLVERWFGS